jgi:serine/threonine protein phosphatase 1
MIESIIKPKLEDHLIFLGDFINKGPESKKVLDYLIKLQGSGFNISAVLGNHEKLLLDMYYQGPPVPDFFQKGGDQTLKSFGVNTIQDIPRKYIHFIEKLSPYLIIGSYVIVHAGINFKAEDPWSDIDSMLTIRGFQAKADDIEYDKVIHGHQASPLKDILARLLDQNAASINLDNGCVYTNREGMGNLFVLNLADMSFHIQPCLDQVN